MDPGLRGFEAPSSSSGSLDELCQPASLSSHRAGFLSHLAGASHQAILRQFTPSWFTVALGTSSVAASVGLCPLQFAGQLYVAWAFWFLAVLLFVVFSCLMLGRMVLHAPTMRHLLAHPNQSLFFGVIPASVSSLTSAIPVLFSARFGDGAAYATAALFWVNLPAVVLSIVLIPFSMFTAHDHGMHSMTAVWLLPVVPATLAANTAALAAGLPDAHHGVSLILMGLALLGIGLPLSFQICTIYYNRLSCHKLPAREVIVSSFLPVGSQAMAAWAFMDLALAGRKHVVAYSKVHLDWDASEEMLLVAANIFLAAAIVVSVLLWGYAVWWLLMAVSSVIETRDIPFNLGWWGAGAIESDIHDASIMVSLIRVILPRIKRSSPHAMIMSHGTVTYLQQTLTM